MVRNHGDSARGAGAPISMARAWDLAEDGAGLREIGTTDHGDSNRYHEDHIGSIQAGCGRGRRGGAQGVGIASADETGGGKGDISASSALIV